MSTELSFYQQDALNFILQKKNPKLEKASETDVELAQKFNTYYHNEAVQ